MRDITSDDHYASLNAAWREYKEEGNLVARDYIIVSYTPLVDRIAKKVYRKKPWIFEIEDLRQIGFIGLMDAVRKFDPERNILFSTFAPMRILGSIYDEINAMDWTPRSVREKIRAVLRATEEHYASNQHRPSVSDLAKISGLDEDHVRMALNYAPKTYISNVDSATVADYETKNPNNGVDFVSGMGNHHETVEEAIDSLYATDALRDAIAQLCSLDEARVIDLHYYQEKTLKEVAAIMGYSPSKVSHIRKAALTKLFNDPNVADIRES